MHLLKSCKFEMTNTLFVVVYASRNVCNNKNISVRIYKCEVCSWALSV